MKINLFFALATLLLAGCAAQKPAATAPQPSVPHSTGSLLRVALPSNGGAQLYSASQSDGAWVLTDSKGKQRKATPKEVQFLDKSMHQLMPVR